MKKRSIIFNLFIVILFSNIVFAYTNVSLSVINTFGQPDSQQRMYNYIVPNKAFHVAGVIVDNHTSPNRIYIADFGNNRILGFDGIGNCNISHNVCTINADCNAGENCTYNMTRNATIVIGQPTLEGYGSCNGNNAAYGPARNDTLCLAGGPSVTTQTEHWVPISMALDNQGSLYVPDPYN